MKTTLKTCALLAVAGLLMAAPVHAQEAAPPAGDEPSDSDIIAAAIGCTATYDYLLQQTPGDARMIEARDFAISIYKQYSNETDAQVADEVAQADQLFVEMLNKGELTLAEVRPTCDAVFMAEDAPGAKPGTT